MKALIGKFINNKKQPEIKEDEKQREIVFPTQKKTIQSQSVYKPEQKSKFVVAHDSHQTKKQKEEDSSNQQQQLIISSLINMSDLIRITKINKELRGQYYTLKHINKLLCEERISTRQLAQFLIVKSGQSLTVGQAQQKSKGKVKSAVGWQSPKKILSNFYSSNSNGLIFQYYSVRALLWKITLGYLPCYKNKWISMMEGNLIKYQEYVREFIIENVLKKKFSKSKGSQNKNEVQQKEKKIVDHPLNRQKASKWKNYFEDNQLWNTLEKDTTRTRPNCKFFQEEFEIQFQTESYLDNMDIVKSQVHLSKLKNKEKTFYYDCLTRILYIYLKNHPEVTYCQGMNELVSLVFYCFANKNSEYFRRVAESDTYFCFEILMHLLNGHSNSHFLNGQKYSKRLQEMLKKIDLRLYESLQQYKMLDCLRAMLIRWFNVLFLREYEIDQSLILWDSFISVSSLQSTFNEYKEANIFQSKISMNEFMLYIGLAIIHLHRNELYDGGNPLILFGKLTEKPQQILEKAVNLYKIFHKTFQ